MTIRKTYAVIPFLILSSVVGVQAEVKLDGTLGTHGNIAGPSYAIEATMGKQQGASLFHSFEKFNVCTGESATFKGPAGIERIISRVTGGSASNIEGLIKSEIQGADFYFINPFGMMFGPNASLDITGSFYATSADYVKLGQNGRFDARNPENTVLTADAPEAFGFLGQKPGDIAVHARKETVTDAETTAYSGLEVDGDSRMMLAGGDIKIDNGIVQTHSGNLDIAAVASAGELDIENPDVRDFEDLGEIEAVNYGHIYSKGGGDIKCQAGSVEISCSDIQTTAQSGVSKAGDVTVNARDSVTVSGSFDYKFFFGFFDYDFYLNVLNGVIALENDSLLDVRLKDLGDGYVLIDTYSESYCYPIIATGLGSTGNGNVLINTAKLNVINGASVYSENTGLSNNAGTGNIDINASESIYVSGGVSAFDRWGFVYQCGIYSDLWSSESVSGGNITIRSPEVVIEKCGELLTFADAGNSGNIILDVDRLKVLEGGHIYTSTHGFGQSEKAGDIDINASDSVYVSGYCYLPDLYPNFFDESVFLGPVK